ncbi:MULTISPECIES: PIG-L deacetylase family protein [Pseudidiomarina]|uniref:LmbE family N-acetylglucosaminyl deacetylase n=2 Tax=Pseudidiomarina TaxID=2800384 RepID=A0A368UJQ3_9GAMM|nr:MULTISPECIES: PIG-L family deacetylase [Pseudidiomarina]PWW06854.1 LmbE family N-acetylglucosaminyl deacetylase [Pseudidiomarina maritima]RBP86596.1 LmbE family N-acetylglucosaminyl deacetylase [Pseudidiomarina tainanensis]RCW28873.1 LmbE family N-acetylglucosaminyl deacetylase [Pseudidiomarina tainanensis]
MNKVNLVVVAHPDDEILGFGAAGAKLAEQGEVVQPIILCGNVDVRNHRPTDDELYQDMYAANAEVGFNEPVLGTFPNIRMNTVPHVEIVQFIEKQIEAFKPARIFTHHPGDLNDDHVQISRACQAAARLYQRRADIPPLQALYFMEILSSTDWAFSTTGENFIPSNFVEIGEEFLSKKIKALSHYRKVMRPFPHPRSDEVLRGLAAYRGGQAGLNYAEAFQLVFQQGI